MICSLFKISVSHTFSKQMFEFPLWNLFTYSFCERMVCMIVSDSAKVKVRYENRMEQIESGKLGAVEQDLFFYICSRVREHGDAAVNISFDSIRSNTGFYTRSNQALAKRLKDVSKKLITFNYEHVIEEGVVLIGTIFSTFIVNAKEKTLSVSVNQDLAFLLNCLDGNFTEWELGEFVRLGGAYSKRLYRICAQWKNVGSTPLYGISELRMLMGVSENVENKYFLKRILEPAVLENEKYFFNLTPVVKRAKAKGAPIEGVSFCFKKPLRIVSKSNS